MEPLGLDPVPILDAGAAGGGSACHVHGTGPQETIFSVVKI